MGLLDNLMGGGDLGDVLGALGGGEGLGQVVERLQQGGLQEAVSSWISTGGNLPVSASQLQDALGQGGLADIASRLGVSGPGAADQLADLLPGVIDRLSPDGQLPGMVGNILGGLLRR